MRSSQRPLSLRKRRRGVAALTVVMILFFVMALVAAYTNRNLVFEQRISANSYRSARALDASEAAIDWTLSMLNGGRIDANCVSSNDTVNNEDFRRNYLRLVDIDEPKDQQGRYKLAWSGDASKKMFPSCVSRNGVLNCICPTLTNRSPAIALPADGIGTAFNVFLQPATSALQPGTLNIDALGCASIGSGTGACYNQSSQFQVVADAKSAVRAGIGLVQALPVAPEATLTAGGTVASTPGILTVSNTDGSNSNNHFSVIAGGAINTANVLPGTGLAANDPASSALAALGADAWFKSHFAMDRATFKRQPAVVVLNCATGCNSTQLTDIQARYPRNPIWIEGDFTINSPTALGSMPATPTALNIDDWKPVLLIITGTLTVAANVNIVGFVHAGNVAWTADATLDGALMTTGNFVGSGNANLNYRRNVLQYIGLYYGSFVRVPGSWKQLNTVS